MLNQPKRLRASAALSAVLSMEIWLIPRVTSVLLNLQTTAGRLGSWRALGRYLNRRVNRSVRQACCAIRWASGIFADEVHGERFFTWCTLFELSRFYFSGIALAQNHVTSHGRAYTYLCTLYLDMFTYKFVQRGPRPLVYERHKSRKQSVLNLVRWRFIPVWKWISGDIKLMLVKGSHNGVNYAGKQSPCV